MVVFCMLWLLITLRSPLQRRGEGGLRGGGVPTATGAGRRGDTESTLPVCFLPAGKLSRYGAINGSPPQVATLLRPWKKEKRKIVTN